VEKPDGYYVFTREAVNTLTVRSGYYAGFDGLPMDRVGGRGGGAARVARFGLAPLHPDGADVHEFSLPEGEVRHVGFVQSGAAFDARPAGVLRGYALASDVAEGESRVALVKNDLKDLTWLMFAAVAKSGEVFSLRFADSEGHGVYRLVTPSDRMVSARDVRVYPMRRMVGPDGGVLRIPLARDALQEGDVVTICIADEEGDSMDFSPWER
jgi:hypothetical protein